MLVHLRLSAPASLSERVQSLLQESDCAINLVVHEGVCRDPVGDLVECDVAREEFNELLGALRDTGLDEQGAIVGIDVDDAPFRAARELEASLPGDPADAVIWDAVLEDAEEATVPAVSYLLFLVLAVTLAGVAVVTDSPVLVVGAMVVGPDFAVVAALVVGLVFGRLAMAAKGFVLLVASFAFAIGWVVLMALLARTLGILDAGMVTRPRPLTGFIWHPDVWSFVVALVAGTAGVLALSLQRTSVMVGVFISVTTVPAAGNLALGLAVWAPDEIVGSLAQLGVNLTGMLLAGSVFLAFQRLFWRRLTIVSERLLGGARRA